MLYVMHDAYIRRAKSMDIPTSGPSHLGVCNEFLFVCVCRCRSAVRWPLPTSLTTHACACAHPSLRASKHVLARGCCGALWMPGCHRCVVQRPCSQVLWGIVDARLALMRLRLVLRAWRLLIEYPSAWCTLCACVLCNLVDAILAQVYLHCSCTQAWWSAFYL